MKNKEVSLKLNLINYKIKVIGINDINPKKEKYNQDLIFNETCFHSHNDKIFPKYNSTITNNNENDKVILNEQNKNNFNLNNIKESFSQDKFIQTPANFYSFDNIEKIKNNYLTPNRAEKKKKDKYKINNRYKEIENNKNIHIVNSGVKSALFSKSYYNKFGKIKNIKHSRNKVYPLISNNKHKNKTNEMKTYFKKFNILKEYFNNTNKEQKRSHHNLLTIENIYFQGRQTINNYQIKPPEYDQNRQLNLTLFKKKYSVKEIKYPLYNNVRKQYKIINDNNDYLLEEIYKKQTLSNFNNKYALKYKTNNSVKKENIKTLFSLLKKYKHSDEDKKIAFNKYNSMKKIRKIFNI